MEKNCKNCAKYRFCDEEETDVENCKQCEKEYMAEYRKTHKRKYQYNKWEGVEKIK